MNLSDIKVLLIQVRHDEILEQEFNGIVETSKLSAEQFVRCNVFEELPTTKMLDGVSAVIIGGSGAYCLSERVIAKEINAMNVLVREVYERKISFLGICFGSHIMTDALGGVVEHHPEIKEFGSSRVRLTEAALTDPLFEGLPLEFSVQQGHKDGTVVLPKGAISLASSDLWSYQAFVMKDAPMYGIQFHPELNEKTVRSRMNAYLDHYLGNDRDEFEQVLNSLVPSPESETLLPRFFEKIVLPYLLLRT